MSVIFPAPFTSLALFAIWLALARSTSVGQLVLAFILATAIPLLTSNLRAKARIKRPLSVLRFAVNVTRDVVVSNLEIAWSVVTYRWRKPRTAFVVIPLELRDDVGLAALAMVTAIVPGTVWSEIALDRSALLLHVWDLEEEKDFVARFKERYEKPLREIFE